MSTKSENAGVQGSYRQFDTRGMFVFVLACSVYLAVIISLRPAFDPYWRESLTRTYVTIPVAWIFFWWLYRTWRLPHALIVHSSGPVLVLGVLMFVSFLVFVEWVGDVLSGFTKSTEFLFDPSFHSQLATVMGVGFVIGCGLGTLVSFPMAILMLVYLGSIGTSGNSWRAPR